VWLLLAHHLEAEHPLIEIEGALQVRRADADVVYGRALEVDIVRSRGGGSTGGERRKTRDQLPAAQRAFLEVSQKIGNDRFHVRPSV
jgi:hypothetical protein